MRTCALIVVLAATFAAGCGDNPTMATTTADICASGAVDGEICGKGKICRSNMCVLSTCGDGVVAAGEQCDGGPGCKADCTFLCTDDPATQCAGTAAACQQFACKTDHSCGLVADEAANLKPCDPSNAANVCIAGACKAAPVCGNGIVEFGEDCDDGNFNSNDGCDRCSFEQVARVTQLIQQFGTDSFCTKNALGTAITTLPVARNFIQGTWTFPIQQDGRISLVFKFMGAIDPSGARSAFNLGFIDATPVRVQQADGTPADSYDGANDLDWWYTARVQNLDDPFDTPNISLDANGTPRVQLPAEIFNRHLTAGPGTIENLRLRFADAPANVELFNVHIDATLDAKLSKPTVSTTAMPPGHVASEHLSPDFITFESSGLTSAAGGMCSDVSAKSLATNPIGLLGGCADPSDPNGETLEFPDNHLLDVFIVGCQLHTEVDGQVGFFQTILPTQPDGSLDGATYTFAADPVTHQVTSCTKDGNDAVLDDCLANATYSSYFKIAADRVILRTDLPPVLVLPP